MSARTNLLPGASLWDSAARSRLKSFHRKTVEAATDIIRLAFAMMNGEESVQIGILLQAYIDGVGSYEDSTRYRLKQVTDELGQKHGLISEKESFFAYTWSVKHSFVEQYCPGMLSHLFDARTNEALEATQALDSCPNELMDLRLPKPLGGSIQRPRRGPLRIYGTQDVTTYIHPFQYQIMSEDRNAYWISGSPRALSRQSIPEIAVQKLDSNIIVVQDRFGFANLCHFMFDGVTRVLQYAKTYGACETDIFVFGSIPGEYQELVCTALATHIGVPPENFIFPTGPHLLSTTGRCFWFSDQVEGHSHPAQMAHPHSISALAELCLKLPGTKSGARRVYVSRGDADRRRIVNEPELISALERAGFVSVQLAKMTAQEQIGLFRGADIVIGPHGMGLTHIIMGTTLGRVIELFHPNAGTDAYAYIARAGGIQYDFLLGHEAPNSAGDFTIEVSQVLDLLGSNDICAFQTAWHKSANLIPTSRTFQDFAPRSTSTPTAVSYQSMTWGESTKIHTLLDVATEVGRWPHILVTPGKLYTLSCWVWIPKNFEGDRVWIQIGEWAEGDEAIRPADLKQAEHWQRISFTSRSPEKDRCWAELHIQGPIGSTVVSTCWQFELGPIPSGYVTTG